MSHHIHKDDVALGWLDARDIIKTGLRNIVRRVENEVLRELDEMYTDALNDGGTIEIRPSSNELKQMFRKAVLELLPEPDEDDETYELPVHPNQLTIPLGVGEMEKILSGKHSV